MTEQEIIAEAVKESLLEGERVFRKISDCNETNEAQDERTDDLQRDLQNVRLEFTEIKTKLSILIGILVAIATPVIPMCLKYLFRG